MSNDIPAAYALDPVLLVAAAQNNHVYYWIAVQNNTAYSINKASKDFSGDAHRHSIAFASYLRHAVEIIDALRQAAPRPALSDQNGT